MKPREFLTAVLRPVLFATGIAAIAVLGVMLVTGYWSSTPNSVRTAYTSASTTASTEQADQQWADTACTSVLDWKHDLHSDETSVDLGFGPLARIDNAITATQRLADELTSLGLPPSGRTAQARRQFAALGSDVQTQITRIKSAAGQVESGNPLAALAAVENLKADSGLATDVAGAVRHLASVDLGLAVIETSACRRLAGSPV